MKREELKEMLKDVEGADAIVDKIMTMHGKVIEKTKTELDSITEEKEALEKQTKEKDKLIKDYEEKKIDKTEYEEKLKQSDEAHKAELQKIKEESAKKDKINSIRSYLGTIEFTSDLAKESVEAKLIEKDFKLDGDKLLGADDYINELKTSNPSAFKEADKKNPKILDEQKNEKKTEDTPKTMPKFF